VDAMSLRTFYGVHFNPLLPVLFLGNLPLKFAQSGLILTFDERFFCLSAAQNTPPAG
jgi:hypothetical protein